MTGEAIIFGGGEAATVAGTGGAAAVILNPVTAAVAVAGAIIFYPSEIGDGTLQGYKNDFTETTQAVPKIPLRDFSNTPEGFAFRFQACKDLWAPRGVSELTFSGFYFFEDVAEVVWVHIKMFCDVFESVFERKGDRPCIVMCLTDFV